MCGIVGYLGTTPEAIDAVLEGLTILQNRGYDSVGLSTVVNHKLQTNKHASTTSNNAIKLLRTTVKPTKSTIAIGHTRWATHGSKTDVNAHPHHDSRNRIAVVHNGIIENFQEIKQELVEVGYAFRSSTDTEVISMLIGSLLDKGETMLNAIKKSVDRLKGTWALVIIHKDYPNMLWAVRNGSPLLLGTNTQCVMVASEASAFHQYVNQYVVLKDHDVLAICLDHGQFTYNKSLSKYPTQIKSMEAIQTTPGPWPHWMIKEIREQPGAVLRAINNGARISSATTVKLGGLDSCRELLVDSVHLILLGCGTSFHAGLWSLDLFKSLYTFDTVSLYDGADFSAKDVPLNGKTAVILLSQSGETKDLQRCIQIIQDKGLVSIGVVNVVDSFIARETNCGVYLNSGREVAVASTKSFTNQCVVLALLSVWFSQNRGTCEEKRRKIIADLHQLPVQIENILSESNEQKIRFLANSIRTTKSMFLLGKGKEEAIAKEGALKLKEIARIHAEGYSTSALKHGPFGLLEPGMPVIVMDVGEENRDKTASSIQEIKARDAWIYILRDNSEDSFFNFESNTTFGGLLANVSLQWLSYEYAVLNGFSPDYPRNLAKVVTVE